MTLFDSLLSFLLTGFVGGSVVYIHQKFKNIAAKEDLSELTEIVEEVKQSYQKENEHLKAQLSLQTDRKIQVFTEEKEAIIEFYSKVNECIWDKLNIALYEYGFQQLEMLAKKIIEMNESYNELNVLYAKVRLLVDDNELILLGQDLISKILPLHSFVTGKCSTYKYWLGVEKASFEALKKVIEERPNKPIDSDFAEFAKKTESELEKIRQDFFDGKSPLFNETIKHSIKFQQMAKKYIRTT